MTQFTTQDLALSLDMFSDRVLKPAVAAIANKIDRDGTLQAANNTANIVGVAGTPPTGLITYLTAAAYLDSDGAPGISVSVWNDVGKLWRMACRSYPPVHFV